MGEGLWQERPGSRLSSSTVLVLTDSPQVYEVGEDVWQLIKGCQVASKHVEVQVPAAGTAQKHALISAPGSSRKVHS